MPLPFTVRRTDPDAAAFCARSGASDRAAVSAFVRGVKDLGLWESMVCWPLRSEQNAGTGTTAYSLGGLGTFDGALVNGPTWGVDGLDINGSNSQSVTVDPTPLTDFTTGHSWFIVMMPTGANPQPAGAEQIGVTSGGGSVLHAGGRTIGTVNINFNTRTTTGRTATEAGNYTDHKDRFAFLFANAAAATTRYKSSGGTLTNSTIIGSSNAYNSGTSMAILATNGCRNTLALILVTAPQFNFTTGMQDSLESLYKSTLGTGLGLP